VRSLGGDQVWLEQVRLETTPLDEADGSADTADGVRELLRFVRQSAGDDGLLADLREAVRGLQTKLRSDLKEGPEPLDFDQPETWAGLLPAAEELLRSRLTAARRQGG